MSIFVQYGAKYRKFYQRTVNSRYTKSSNVWRQLKVVIQTKHYITAYRFRYRDCIENARFTTQFILNFNDFNVIVCST